MFLKKITKIIFIKIIRFYQIAISPLFPSCCRFYPTCSQYAIEAIEKFGPFKSIKLIFKRIIRCRPGSDYGYDPVPNNLLGK